MKALSNFLVYIGATVVFGALLSYLLFLLIHHSLFEQSALLQIPFHKVAPRAFLLVALVALWPLLKIAWIVNTQQPGIWYPAEGIFGSCRSWHDCWDHDYGIPCDRAGNPWSESRQFTHITLFT